MFVEVAVNLPVESTFHYDVPPDLAGRLEIGHLVEVSFGKQLAQGIVLGFSAVSEYADVAKPVRRIIDQRPVLASTQITLARWLSAAYIAPLADCVRLFIPPGLSRRGDVQVRPVIDPLQIEPRSDTQTRLLKLLAQRGSLRGRQIAHSLPRRDWQAAVTQLVDRGLLIREPILDPPSVKPKRSNVVELAVAPARIEAVIAAAYNPADYPANRQAAAARRAAILRVLARRDQAVTVSEVYAEVPDAKLNDLRVLADDDLVILREREVLRDPLGERRFVPDTPPPLTRDQAAAWARIEAALDEETPKPILLHGVTGSGKTELYLRAAARALERGQSAIVLVPEIALTPQTVRRFGARFPGELGLIHSSLSTGERYDTWRRARAGQFKVVIGPRSALFTPMQHLGLIVIDESHDDSYKQSPPIDPPYYHTIDTAVELGRLSNALVMLGSATPDITRYARARQTSRYTLIDLPARIMGHRSSIEEQAQRHNVEEVRYVSAPGEPEEAVMIGLPPVQVVDMRQELRAGNRSIFSRALQQSLNEVLARDEQAILFLNRRGSATHVVCRDCGHVMTCPNTDIPMTYHTHGPFAGQLVCHLTGHTEPHPDICPNCGSARIKFFGTGTQKLEDAVREAFPAARLVRWDTDSTSGKGSHEALIERFVSGEANVLVGTQMVAKGLDLPLVTLVGVISADTALYLPDFRAGERTFQLLTQVAGRAGRGLRGGHVILQTYAPEHYAVRAAAQHDFAAFYQKEIAYRAEMGYPPYSRMVRLIVRGYDLERVQEEARAIYAQLTEARHEQGKPNIALIGPVPCFYDRIGDVNRWQVIVRGEDPASLVADTISPARYLQIDVDPVSLL